MSLQKTPKSHEEVSHILSYVNPDCDNDTWVMTAFAVKSELGDSGQGIWVNWSQQSDKYDAGRAKSVWRGAKTEGGITIASLVDEAKKAGYNPKDRTFAPVSPEEMARREAEAERKRQEEKRREQYNLKRMNSHWEQAADAVAGHPYMLLKGCGTPNGLKVVNWPLPGWADHKDKVMYGWLMVPSYAADGSLARIQFISEDGKAKLNSIISHTEKGTFTVGELVEGEIAYIVEGIGHAWSVNAITGCAAVVCFGNSNYLDACKQVEAKGALPVIIPDRGSEVKAQCAGYPVVTLPQDMPNGADINDLHQECGADAVLALLETKREVSVFDGAKRVNLHAATDAIGKAGVNLALNDRLEPYVNLSNAMAVLRSHPRFAGRIWYDTFHQAIITTWDCDQPRPWVDSDRLRVAEIFQREFGLVKFNDELVDKAARAVAQENQKDELKDWLESLKWDGKPRLNKWLHLTAGTDDDEYHNTIGANFIKSMIARAIWPGSKVDTMPVIEGEQGLMKSTMLSTLGGKFFAELTESMDSKDFCVTIQGVWLMEIGEMHSMSKADVTLVKQKLSIRSDRYRTPYGRIAETVPRRVVFAGTTNESQYLRDTTGARRFWPAAATKVDIEWLQANREQLFAEAMVQVKAGAKWWEVPQEEARAQAEARRVTDMWEDIIAEKLGHRTKLKLAEVLEALGFLPSAATVAEQKRAAEALRALGYKRKKIRFPGDSVAKWGFESEEVNRISNERPF